MHHAPCKCACPCWSPFARYECLAMKHVWSTTTLLFALLQSSTRTSRGRSTSSCTTIFLACSRVPLDLNFIIPGNGIQTWPARSRQMHHSALYFSGRGGGTRARWRRKAQNVRAIGARFASALHTSSISKTSEGASAPDPGARASCADSSSGRFP